MSAAPMGQKSRRRAQGTRSAKRKVEPAPRQGCPEEPPSFRGVWEATQALSACRDLQGIAAIMKAETQRSIGDCRIEVCFGAAKSVLRFDDAEPGQGTGRLSRPCPTGSSSRRSGIAGWLGQRPAARRPVWSCRCSTRTAAGATSPFGGPSCTPPTTSSRPGSSCWPQAPRRPWRRHTCGADGRTRPSRPRDRVLQPLLLL